MTPTSLNNTILSALYLKSSSHTVFQRSEHYSCKVWSPETIKWKCRCESSESLIKETKRNPRVKVREKSYRYISMAETNGCNKWIIICNCRGVAVEIKCGINILLHNAPLLVITNSVRTDLLIISPWLGSNPPLTHEHSFHDSQPYSK